MSRSGAGTNAKPIRPTKAQLESAHGRTVADVIAPGVKIMFCGINPGLYSGAVGHHFARPGNRFWPALHRAGFTPWQLSPFEERELLRWGYGITNLVKRTTASAAELSVEELAAGARRLHRLVRKYRPKWLAVLGVGAYRSAFDDSRTTVGPQDRTLAGTRIWVLPNPSGLNAHYQLDELVELFSRLRQAAKAQAQADART